MIDIAQRAGLTKSTFFRHFPDKREVLFGHDTMTRLLVEAIVAAPVTATPLEAVVHALDAVGGNLHPRSPRIQRPQAAVIAASPELQEREALEGLGLTASMTDALKRRGVPDLASCVAAELGALTLKIAYERWSDTANGDDFGEVGGQHSATCERPVPCADANGSSPSLHSQDGQRLAR